MISLNIRTEEGKKITPTIEIPHLLNTKIYSYR